MRLLRILAERYPSWMSVEDLADLLGENPVTLRKKLARLESLGLVETAKLLRGSGRPPKAYRLNIDALCRLDPQQHRQLYKQVELEQLIRRLCKDKKYK